MSTDGYRRARGKAGRWFTVAICVAFGVLYLVPGRALAVVACQAALPSALCEIAGLSFMGWIAWLSHRR